ELDGHESGGRVGVLELDARPAEAVHRRDGAVAPAHLGVEVEPRVELHVHLGRLTGRHLVGEDLEVAVRLPAALGGGEARERGQEREQEVQGRAPLDVALLGNGGGRASRRVTLPGGGGRAAYAGAWRACRQRACWRPGLGRMRCVRSCHLSSPKPYLRPRSRLAAELPPTVVRPSSPTCRPRLEPSRCSRPTAVTTPPERLRALA